MSQDHQLFSGLSIAQDIGLGRWQEQGRRDLVDQCLLLGGSKTLLTKLRHGGDTILEPADTKDEEELDSDAPLRKLFDDLEKSVRVSGGEKQRLVAYASLVSGFSDQSLNVV